MARKKYYPNYSEMVRIIEMKVPVNATFRSRTIFLYALDETTEFELDLLGVSTVTFGGLSAEEIKTLTEYCHNVNFRINDENQPHADI